MSKLEKGTGKINPEHASALPRGAWYPEMGAYGQYRFTIQMAGLSGKPGPENQTHVSLAGPIGEHPFSSAYSKEDADIITMARKICGMPESTIAPGNSKESDDIHKVSPVGGSSRKKHWHKRDEIF